MTEQSSESENLENTLGQTLRILNAHAGMDPAEIAQLRLSDLHLAGKTPHIQFKPAGSDEPKIVELDMDAHRALVGWLVSRPDTVSDLLFPSKEDGALDTQTIQQFLTDEEESGRAEAQPGAPAAPDVSAEATTMVSDQVVSSSPSEEGTRTMGSPSHPPPPPKKTEDIPSQPGRPLPPRSAPEAGTPPPGLTSAEPKPIFSPPPPTIPEAEEMVDIPLPTAVPKHPPVPPPKLESPRSKKMEPPVKVTPVTPPPAPTPVGSVPARETPKASPRQGRGATKTHPQPQKSTGPTAAQAAQNDERTGRAKIIVPLILGIGLICVLVCLGGGVFAWRSGVGPELLAGAGIPGITVAENPTDEAGIEPVVQPESPLPTPTLPPTQTPTSLPPTNIPVPTDTPTPVPTDTPAPTDTVSPPTDTPVPTDTPEPLPTDTSVPVEPEESPTPEGPSTPAVKYQAPVLLEPKNDFEFIYGNTIVLRWQSVGELAPDEQYAVRLRYQYNGEATFQGTNLKETEWTIPLSLFGQVDPPENLYEWFVIVERVNDDGSGTAISPESEIGRFTWK